MNAALTRVSAAEAWGLPWQEHQRRLALGSVDMAGYLQANGVLDAAVVKRTPIPGAQAPATVSWLRRGQARR